MIHKKIAHIHSVIRKLPVNQIASRAIFKLSGGAVTLKPASEPKGRVLLSYTTLPFLVKDPKILDGHSNRWECVQMAQEFVDRGYIVDVIDFNNGSFKPKHKYAYCIDIDSSLERLSKLLNPECILVFYATAGHWLFWNSAEYNRLADIQKRRGATIFPRRTARPTRAPDVAHVLSSLCGTFPNSTYDFLKKPIFSVPPSSSHTYPEFDRDISKARKNFIWFGGSGVVRKGLDLALEAFAGMPELTLAACGKYDGEKDFTDAYAKELTQTPNIKAMGHMDPSSKVFEDVLKNSISIVYPSSAEGCSTAVLLAMHAGLIPIVSKETGIETGDFGIMLPDCSLESIRKAVRDLAAEPAEKLWERSRKTREYVLKNHTRESFAANFKSFVSYLEKNHAK
ncbi:MAG TPA: glycosyltransferase family 4 protein [Candidatus Paceibacterota bacterium]